MTRKEAIAELKETIKSLTNQQIEDKKILRQPHDAITWSTMNSAWARGVINS